MWMRSAHARRRWSMGLELMLAWSLGLAAAWWFGRGVAPSFRTSRALTLLVAVVGLAVVDTPPVWSGLWAVLCVAVALQPTDRGRFGSSASAPVAASALVVIAGACADVPAAKGLTAFLTTFGLVIAALSLTRTERSSAWTGAEWALAAGLATACLRAGVGTLPTVAMGPLFESTGAGLSIVAQGSLALVMVHGCARPNSGRLPMLAALWAGGMSSPWEAWVLGLVGMTLGMRGADNVAPTYLARGAAVAGLMAAVSVASGAPDHGFIMVAGAIACAVWGLSSAWVGGATNASHGETPGPLAAVDHAMRRASAGAWALVRGMGSALDLGVWTPLRTEGRQVVRERIQRTGAFVAYGSPSHPAIARVCAALGFALVLGWLMLKPTASSILPDDVFDFGGLHPELRGTGARTRAVRSGGEGSAR